MSFEKLQRWLKNYNKFKAPLDVDLTVDDCIRNLQKIKEVSKTNPEDHTEELSISLGKVQNSLLELANLFNLNLDVMLRDKFKFLDSGSANAPKHAVTVQKSE